MTQRTVLFPSSHSSTNTRFTLPRISGGALITSRFDLELRTVTANNPAGVFLAPQGLARVGGFGIIDTIEVFRNGTLLSTLGPNAGMMAAIKMCTLSSDAAERMELQTQGGLALQVNQMGSVPRYIAVAPGVDPENPMVGAPTPANVVPTAPGASLVPSSFGQNMQTGIGATNPVLPLNFLMALFASNPLFPLDDQIDIVITYDLTQFNNGGQAAVTLDNTTPPRLYVETVAETTKKLTIAPWLENVHTVATLPALAAAGSDNNSIQVRIVNKNIIGLYGLVQDPATSRSALFTPHNTLGCARSLSVCNGPVAQLNVTINGSQIYPRPVSTPAEQLREFALSLNSDYVNVPSTCGARGCAALPASNATSTLSVGNASPVSALSGALAYLGFDCRRNGGAVDVDNSGVYFNIARTALAAETAKEIHVWAACIAVA